MKVAAWVDDLMEMDDCELSPEALRAIREKWHQGSPEAPEMILDELEAHILQELNF
jgi:hypothetical protein